MKKQKMVKCVVALTLTMVLMLSTAMSVCARGIGSYSWKSNGTLYTASVSVNNSSSGSTTAYSTARTIYHYQGENSMLSAPIGYTVYKNWSNTFPAAYRTYLNTAMSNAGYPVSAAFSFPHDIYVAVPKNQATGRYAILAGVSTHSGSWQVIGASTSGVTEPMAANPQAANSGSMSGVPGNLTGYYTFIKVG